MVSFPHMRVLYEHVGGDALTLYVLGQNHGPPEKHQPSSIMSQMIIYFALDSLVREGLELALVEGRSASEHYAPCSEPFRSAVRQWLCASDEYLKAHASLSSITLTDSSIDLYRFLRALTPMGERKIDAGLLAQCAFDVSLQGYEHSEVHVTAGVLMETWMDIVQRNIDDLQRFGELRSRGAAAPAWEAVRALADRFNFARSGYLLVNAPLVWQREYDSGAIHSRQAAAIIGGAHLEDIVGFLKAGEIVVPSMRLEWYPELVGYRAPLPKDAHIVVLQPFQAGEPG
jgi:hypothetical protein